MNKERNIKLDLLRFFGVLIIMIAHASPPEWLFQLRNFGTPLLIAGSSLTYAFIYKYREINTYSFIKKRMSRLIIPAWIFLTFFFSFFIVMSKILGKNYELSFSEVLESYTFYDGIGFVWIFKIYIILALLTPLALKFSKSTLNNTSYFLIIISVYFLNEIGIYFFLENIPYEIKDFISKIFLILIPYTAIYLYGLRLGQLSSKTILTISLTSFLIFISMAISKYIDQGYFVQTQEYKYPPTLYYLSYAFFCLNLVYFYTSKHLNIEKIVIKELTVWLSSHSLWIYLWHIMGISVWLYIGENKIITLTGTFGLFILKFIFIFSFGILITYIQVSIVGKLIKMNRNYLIEKILLFLK